MLSTPFSRIEPYTIEAYCAYLFLIPSLAVSLRSFLCSFPFFPSSVTSKLDSYHIVDLPPWPEIVQVFPAVMKFSQMVLEEFRRSMFSPAQEEWREGQGEE